MAADRITVRQAGAADVESLVSLRAANARAHIALDPQAYRVPDAEAVRRHFGDERTRERVLVAELAGRVVGMVEVVPNPAPPDHQILRPRPSAQIHTVVLEDARGQGAGAALAEAAERWAAEHGIAYLTAGIHHGNAGAVRFYTAHGYTGSGISLARPIPPSPGRPLSRHAAPARALVGPPGRASQDSYPTSAPTRVIAVVSGRIGASTTAASSPSQGAAGRLTRLAQLGQAGLDLGQLGP